MGESSPIVGNTTSFYSAFADSAPISTGVGAVNTKVEDGGDPIRGAVIDGSGRPVPQARVIVEGLGDGTTDGAGQFSISGPEAGRSYKVVVQRPGFSFPQDLFAAASTTVSITGAAVSFNSLSCPSEDVTTVLVEAAKVARQFRDETIQIVPKIPPRARLRLLSGEVIQAAVLPERAQLQFVNYQGASMLIPEVVLYCPSGSSCAAGDVSGLKALMILELENLSHERLLVNRKLRDRGSISSERANAVLGSTKAARNRAIRLVRGLSDGAQTCP
jgi:hypothetical protein